MWVEERASGVRGVFGCDAIRYPLRRSRPVGGREGKTVVSSSI